MRPPPPRPAPPSDASPSDAEEDAAPFDSHVAAFDLRTREPLWDPIELDAVSRTGVVVDGEKAFFGVNGGTVYAVDLADGRVAWTTELNRVVGTPLSVSEGAVVVGLQASSSSPRPTLVSLDAENGEERWRIDDEGAAAIVSTATIAGSTVFAAFSGGQESSIDAIELDSGARSWRARFPRFFDLSATAPPVVTDEAVFVVDTQGEAYRLDRATGDRVWEFALNEGVLRAAPVATGGYLVVAPIDGSLVALEASTGDLVWRGEGDGFPIRAVAVAGDLLVAVRSGPGAGLIAFGHDPSAALVREVSPTHMDLARLAGSFAVAALAMVALMVLAGRYLAGRMGPAFPAGLPDPDAPTEEPGEGEDTGGAP